MVMTNGNLFRTLGINETGVKWSGNTVLVMVELGDREVNVTLLEDYRLGSNCVDVVTLASVGEKFFRFFS